MKGFIYLLKNDCLLSIKKEFLLFENEKLLIS